MADTADRPAVRKEGSAFVIQLPRRGKQRQEIPSEVVDSLVAALEALTLEGGEGVAVPKDDLSELRTFEKAHQASNYGRKLTEELAAKAPRLGELTRSTISLEHDADGKPTGPFALALSRKEKKR